MQSTKRKPNYYYKHSFNIYRFYNIAEGLTDLKKLNPASQNFMHYLFIAVSDLAFIYDINGIIMGILFQVTR
jgi:hypothetical protein